MRARQALVPLQYTPQVEAIPSISVLVFPAIVTPLVPSVTIRMEKLGTMSGVNGDVHLYTDRFTVTE